MKRNGSLSLSIQAIVILVMAMAVLGLGLTFIRTLIGQGQEQFEGAIANAELKNPASSDIPVTIPTEIRIKKGSTETFEVGFYNKGSTGEYKPHFPDKSTCHTLPNAPDPVKAFDFGSLSQEVDPGEAVGYEVSIKALDGLLIDDSPFICTVEIQNAAGEIQQSKQFFVELAS